MILFKAKRVDNGDWIYGSLIERMYSTNIGGYEITPMTMQDPLGDTIWIEEKVIPETVCQFVNLTDKDEIKIFANDLRIDSDGVVFRIYATFGGFVIKAHYWKKDINDLVSGDELIFEHLSNPQTADWVCNSTTHYGNANDKI